MEPSKLALFTTPLGEYTEVSATSTWLFPLNLTIPYVTYTKLGDDLNRTGDRTKGARGHHRTTDPYEKMS